MTVPNCILIVLIVLYMLLPLESSGESVHRMRSGRELPLRDGMLRPADLRLLLQEAQNFIRQGRLDLALDNCHTVRTLGHHTLRPEANVLLARIDRIERSSVVELNNGVNFQGKIRINLRSDQLGLPERRRIPIWEIQRIEAEYLLQYSQVTKTYYILTRLEVGFRDASMVRVGLTEEILIEIEKPDTGVQQAAIGYPYQLLRKSYLDTAFPRLINDRVAKIVIHPALYRDNLRPVVETR